MKDRVNKWLIGTIVVLTLIFPFFLNWVLQIKAFVPVVGDSVTWLRRTGGTGQCLAGMYAYLEI